MEKIKVGQSFGDPNPGPQESPRAHLRYPLSRPAKRDDVVSHGMGGLGPLRE